MVIKLYISGISGNKEVKKKQQRVQMILDSKQINYEAIDITEPGKEKDKEFMQQNGKVRESLGKYPLPPQIFNDDDFCGDYEDFDMANEVDELEKFLHIETSSKDSETDSKDGPQERSKKIDKRTREAPEKEVVCSQIGKCRSGKFSQAMKMEATENAKLDRRLVMEMLETPGQDEDSRSFNSGSVDSSHSSLTYNPYEYHTFKIKFDGVNGVKGEVISVDLPGESEETEEVTKREVNGESEAVPEFNSSSENVIENVETPDEALGKEEGSTKENKTNDESGEKETEENVEESQENAGESEVKAEESEEKEEKAEESQDKVEEDKDEGEGEGKAEETAEEEEKEEQKQEEREGPEEKSPLPEEEEKEKEEEEEKEDKESEKEENESENESPQSEKDE